MMTKEELRSLHLKMMCCEERLTPEEHVALQCVTRGEYLGMFDPYCRIGNLDEDIEIPHEKWFAVFLRWYRERKFVTPRDGFWKLDSGAVKEYLSRNFSEKREHFMHQYALTVFKLAGNSIYCETLAEALYGIALNDGWDLNSLRTMLVMQACGIKLPGGAWSSVMTALNGELGSQVFIPWEPVHEEDSELQDRNNWLAVTLKMMTHGDKCTVENSIIRLNALEIKDWMFDNFSAERLEFVKQYASLINGGVGIMAGSMDSMIDYANQLNELVDDPKELWKKGLNEAFAFVHERGGPPEGMMEGIRAGLIASLKSQGIEYSDARVDEILDNIFTTMRDGGSIEDVFKK